MAAHETLVGVYQSTRWQSDTVAGESPYVIGQLQCGTTVKGTADPGELQPNVAYKFYGKWQPGNDRFPAKSFAFVCAVKEEPHSRQAIVEYLTRLLRSHNTGIGEKTAHRLFDAYKSDAVRKLRMEPDVVASDLHHSLDSCRKAAAILDADRKFEDAKIALVDLFAGSGFPRDAIKACIDRWGAAAPNQIRRDAFLMLSHRIPGAGFLRCDKLYIGLGGDPGKLKRQVLAAHHEIRANSSGDTWRPVQFAVDTIRAKIAGADPRPEKALKVGGRTKRFAFELDRNAGLNATKIFIADGQHAQSEADIARIVCDTSNADLIQPWPEFQQGDLTDHQFAELQRATTGRVGILSGGPGTGKTYTAAALIRNIVTKHGPESVAVCAPTGKAAVRIGESMERYNIPLKATTIHRLLCPNDLGYGTGNWNFSANEQSPLRVEYVIVDESSMIDVDLMASLLRASKFASVLLIGDPHQLPPVGHGAPLRDLIDAKIPTGELKELHRNSGAIVRACHAIKEGRPFQAYTRFNDAPDGPGENLRIIPADSGAAVVAKIGALFAELRSENPQVDLIEDCQVLVGLNDKSEVARKQLNPAIQQLLNPTGHKVEGNPYRVGDKVICLTNDGYIDAANPRHKHKIYNGEMGRVETVTNQHVTFLFPDTGDGERLTKQSCKGEASGAFSLAYAITTHKSQGSEWPIVVVVTDDSAWRIACREFWYTALSRARHRCVILGSLATVGKQCKRVISRDRKTFLREKIEAIRAAKEGVTNDIHHPQAA